VAGHRHDHIANVHAEIPDAGALYPLSDGAAYEERLRAI
jgi:hypothetical protein